MPPTEKRGRVHTSTVTVAVLRDLTRSTIELREADLEEAFCRGSGAGGQHRNKTSTAVQLRHRPSGLMVRCESERSQSRNRENARALLQLRLSERAENQHGSSISQERRKQVGTGMRGDKRRTIAMQRGTVVDNLTGKSWRLKEYMRGEW